MLPIAGKGESDWGYTWIPVVGPLIGGVLGALAYQALFTNWPDGHSAMKKLINAPDDVVDEALAGMVAAHGDLLRVIEPNVVVRADAPRQGKVGVISGGGSGHEPMHGGFVGRGMLDAACPGAVFTSPVPDQMLAATKAVDGGAGVLHIVKNYTGDIMNFELAAELAAGRGDRGHVASSSPTTSPSRTRSTPRAAAAWAGRFSPRRSSGRPPRRARTSPP